MLRDCSSIRASSLILSVFSNVSVSRECSTAADSDNCRDDARGSVSSSRHMTRPPGGLTLLDRPCPPVSICGPSTSFDCEPNKRSGFRNSHVSRHQPAALAVHASLTTKTTPGKPIVLSLDWRRICRLSFCRLVAVRSGAGPIHSLLPLPDRPFTNLADFLYEYDSDCPFGG